ncbi:MULTISPECIES: NADAR family protein [unclassified Burkholderia]|uniref:NADAR family protein n=1 Tax=unclassified Burkholderia TaxID=2613784 RepID=UPI0007562DFF|nr:MULTISPECIES: NADAR family protein [unclassified Burkholderia]KUY49045.1 GTP cyclohydrolase [Burkholderia sp. RF2-non_BP3]KUY85912.1 GTP cyclohydrolase [Burkholderia sp. RF4-BP95]KUY92784.1 GTP cyclohydrolase [Burkholderia sp. RF7-non_BP4]KUY95292.1 GTP cyclohydrolase [Burkholderia sp. RF7-non_BP1]
MRRIGNITAFFGAVDVFSNWHPCRFTYHEVTFNCGEQFIMYAKALLFDDHATAAAILASTSPREQKRLGRFVNGFDDARWVQIRESIMFVGCREKFRQNEAFAAALRATGTSVLVEASAYDRIWGVGLCEHDPRIADPSAWLGLNLLGNTLMRVRDVLSRS